MTFTLNFHWWFIPVALFIFPFLYAAFRKPTGGQFDFQIDTMIILASCWVSAIVSVITHFIR